MYAPPNPEEVSLNTVSSMVTLPCRSFSPVMSARIAPAFLEEVMFVNSQFLMYISPPFLTLIAPAVMLAVKLMNLELSSVRAFAFPSCIAGE